ncbi:hypothetical protein MC7420_7386 [Coleofasciculus chthonoplastes PCC 7420]|uniref:Uncharacterized protein n=1 Tax=Coleofasciculus chthonoplastes PCC 7420 TaxID=118168 RepID=B4VHP3_9CYAN|nr:hypothetical protein MC7420_7386 [Coleofasciculus chthonoplastes PCC 7420]
MWLQYRYCKNVIMSYQAIAPKDDSLSTVEPKEIIVLLIIKS